MIMLIIACSAIFGRLLTLEQLPAKLVTFVVENNVSAPMFLLFLNIILLFVGTFMELNSTILIMTPILIPLAQSLGIDLVHIGIILVVNMTFGLLTPPLGIHLFVGCGLTEVKFEEVVKEIWPFLAIGVVVIFLTTYFPQIPLWLVQVINK